MNSQADPCPQVGYGGGDCRGGRRYPRARCAHTPAAPRHPPASLRGQYPTLRFNGDSLGASRCERSRRAPGWGCAMNESPKPERAEKLLTYSDVADLLCLTVRTISGLVRRGDLRAVKIGGAVRFDPADIRRFVENAKGARP